MTVAAAVALVALIAWLFGLQAVRVGLDPHARSSGAARVTTAVLGGGAALLALPQLLGGQGPDTTALALTAVTGWFIGLQALRVGHERGEGSSRGVRVTSVVLGGMAVLVAVPRLYVLVT